MSSDSTTADSDYQNDFALLKQVYSLHCMVHMPTWTSDKFIEFIESKRPLVPIFRAIMECEIPHGAGLFHHGAGFHHFFPSISEFFTHLRTDEMDDDDFRDFVQEEFETYPLYIKKFHIKKERAFTDSQYFDFLMRIVLRNFDSEVYNLKVCKTYMPFIRFYVKDIMTKLVEYKLDELPNEATTSIENVIARQMDKLFELPKEIRGVEIQRWAQFFRRIWILSKGCPHLENYFEIFLGEHSSIGSRLIRVPMFVQELGFEIVACWWGVSYCEHTKTPMIKEKYDEFVAKFQKMPYDWNVSIFSMWSKAFTIPYADSVSDSDSDDEPASGGASGGASASAV